MPLQRLWHRQVAGTTEQRLERLLETKAGSEQVGRCVVELDQQVDVAPLGIDVVAGGWPNDRQATHVQLAAQVGDGACIDVETAAFELDTTEIFGLVLAAGDESRLSGCHGARLRRASVSPPAPFLRNRHPVQGPPCNSNPAVARSSPLTRTVTVCGPG